MRAEDANISQAPSHVIPTESKTDQVNVSTGPSEGDINAVSEELYQRYMSRRGLCRTQDFVVVAICIGIIVYVWVKVYHQPIPPVILQLLGLDDPVFEKKPN